MVRLCSSWRGGFFGRVKPMHLMKTTAAAAALAISGFASGAPAHAGSNDAIIAGALGFGVGTLFGNATARPRYYAPAPVYVVPARPVYVEPAPVYYELEPWTPDWYAYCGSRYHSFDARSGTYVDFNGYRRMCR
jgi:hypothetical protein